MNEKLRNIHLKNAEYEKESPYNFCDRWCERCSHEKQIRCTLYKDELERKMTCIAHGKDEDDPEITSAVIEAQYKEVDKKLSGGMGKFGIDLDNPDIDEDELNEEDAVDFEDLPPDIQKHIRFVENNTLDATAEQYRKRTHVFLENTFYKNKDLIPKHNYDFETVSWYHTLLPAKIHRALCGFHEPASEGDISLCDAVAQFDICRKAIEESVKSFNKIKEFFPAHNLEILKLLALLDNMHNRIQILESEI